MHARRHTEPRRGRKRPGPSSRLVRRIVVRLVGERGAATAEYAVATMAAVGFARLAVIILR